jgi:hypothetical protein
MMKNSCGKRSGHPQTLSHIFLQRRHVTGIANDVKLPFSVFIEPLRIHLSDGDHADNFERGISRQKGDVQSGIA